ncbi:MAG: Omp28 family outer membrane lipoprotein [Bacteroidota bacterium]
MTKSIKINQILFSSMLLVCMIYFGACDKIEEPFIKKVEIGDTTAGIKKRVLLEDYTGHTCVNCPKAAKSAAALKAAYGDRMIILAVHAGGFANPNPGGDFTYDFRTTAGTEWDVFFGISNTGNPKGMVNRKGYPGAHILTPADWAGNIGTTLKETPALDLEVINQYNSDTRQLAAEITVTFLSKPDSITKLVVVMAESGIVKPQRNNDATVGETPVIYEYEHNHVLRDAITSTWGIPVENAGSSFPSVITKSFTYTLDNEFLPENCAVIAFVYNDANKEILQAAEADVIQK